MNLRYAQTKKVYHNAVDAITDKEHRITLILDRHGLTITVEGCEKELVIDLTNGELNVWPTNENGDIVAHKPAASLVLG